MQAQTLQQVKSILETNTREFIKEIQKKDEEEK